MQEIERLNGVWNTDSMFSKSSIKIPINHHSNDSSCSNSISGSPALAQKRMSGWDSPGSQESPGSWDPTQNRSRSPCETELLKEEVRSKLDVRLQKPASCTAECGEDGVKSIADILNCADKQLQNSRDFIEKLAKKR